MLGKKEWQLPVAFVCLCLGFLLAIQLQTQNVLRRPTTQSGRLSTILELLKHDEEEIRRLEEEMTPLRKMAGGATDSASLRSEFKRLQVMAGLTAAAGPGVVITLDETEPDTAARTNRLYYLVAAEDLLAVVNELRAAGAEAISINGQRLVANSAIRSVGSFDPFILINATRVAPPYIIKAIGNKDDLMQLNMRGGMLENLRNLLGIKTEITPLDAISVPAYNGSISAQYAAPQNEASTEAG